MSKEKLKTGGEPKETATSFDIDQIAEVAQYFKEYGKEHLGKTDDEAKNERIKRQVYEFRRIGSEITTHREDCSSVDELIEKIKAKITRREARLQKKADSKKTKEIESQIRNLKRALDFIQEQQDNPENSSRFKRWKEKKTSVASAETDEPRVDVKQLEAESGSMAREIEKEILLQSIVESGGTVITTSLPQEYHPTKHNGFTDKCDSKRLDSHHNAHGRDVRHTFSSVIQEGVDDCAKKNNIHEFVAIMPIEEDVFEDVEVETTKKILFGLRSKPATKIERQKVGRRTIQHNEIVSQGKTEEAWQLYYYATDANDRAYQDHSGRHGQMFALEVALPRSIARKVQARINSDPAFVREIAREAVIQNLNIPEQAWDKGDEHTRRPLRPPYEAWKQESGKSKMYIHEHKDGPGFKKESIVEV